jgi:hypothetical protein
VRAHIAQVAARRERRPFRRGRVLQTVFAVVGVIETAHGLAILLDELTGVEFGIDHHGVGRGVTEQRLNYANRRVVVQMFGCKNTPAIVRQQHERRAVRAASSRVDRDPRDTAPNGLNASSAGMTDALVSNMALEGEEAKLDWDFSHGHLLIGQLILNQLLCHSWRQVT